MRDAALGVRTDPAARQLLHDLRRGVADGRFLCPISASTFIEVLKQPYSSSRRVGTAQLVDELSLGVSMIPSRMIMGTEIHSFLLTAEGAADLYSMQELIWTKVAYALGDTYPSLAQLSPADELAIQKAFFDHLWDYPLSELVKIMGDKIPPPDRFEDLSREINEKNAQHRDELRSFVQTYDIELKGAIDVAGDLAADVLHRLAEKEAMRKLSPTHGEWATCVNMCRNLLYHAFKKSGTKDILRCIHISASIHAVMRWDKKRKFKPNDYYDFENTVAALSYCDVFLTEGPLHHLVIQPQINLEAVNACRVFSDIEMAADHIREVAR